MKNKNPANNANNGKDIRKIGTHKVHTLGGTSESIKSLKLKATEPYEPKRNNRWLIKFKGAYKGIPEWSLKKTHRPKLVNGNWSNLKITLRDAVHPSTAQALIEGFRNEWQIRHNRIPIIKYSLQMLGPVGDVVEEWEIEGNVIKADFGDLNYEKDRLSEIKLEIKPLKVILLY